MRFAIDVPDFDGALHMEWEPDFTIAVAIEHGAVHIRLNRPGLVSLPRLLLTMVDDRVDDGSHFHLDAMPVGCLEPGSMNLIIGRERS